MYLYNKELNKIEKTVVAEGDKWIPKTYPVSGNPKWEHNQQLVEGKDFKIDYDYKNLGTRKESNEYAFPLPVSETQDELWDKMLAEIGYKWVNTKNAIVFLKEKYSIARKNQ